MGAVKLIVIDSFCGAGGVTEGFHRAKVNGKYCAVVVIGINHDALAIETHAMNHTETQHFVEDFRTLDPNRLVGIVAKAKRQNPGAKVLFQMSAECTHHSKAKGGESRDADSRSLPEHLYRYIDVLGENPLTKIDIITVENVVEFLDWGPLQIKVISDKKGNELYCPIELKKDKKTKKHKKKKEKKPKPNNEITHVVNSSFKHLYFFTQEFKLTKKEKFEPVVEIVNRFDREEPIPLDDNTSNNNNNQEKEE